ncbi:MAG: hypothetical protein N3F09_04570 [Bacteroidia bacterium]|nr:hypothetical protein [Bacteroidia bacterium]
MIAKNFQIEVFTLPFGTHEFEFEADDRFFNEYGNCGFENARLKVNLAVHKKNLIQEADILIRASIPVQCNRCNLSVDFPVEFSSHVVLKKGNPAESNEEIIFAHEEDEFVDFSQFIFDSVMTALPARLIPCEMNSKISCNTDILKKLKNIETHIDVKENLQDPVKTLGEMHADVFKKLSNLFNN